MKKLCLLLFALTAFFSAVNPVTADSCESECWAQWDTCCFECGGGGTYWCYDACDQARDQCLNSC